MPDTIPFDIADHDLDSCNLPEQIYSSLENISHPNLIDQEDHNYFNKSYLDLQVNTLSYLCGNDVLIGATETVETCPLAAFEIEIENESCSQRSVEDFGTSTEIYMEEEVNILEATDINILEVTTDSDLQTKSIEDAVKKIIDSCVRKEVNIQDNSERTKKGVRQKQKDVTKTKGKVSNKGGAKRTRKPFTGKPRCTICDAEFSTKGTLKKHMLTHSGERPFQCDKCEKSFTRPTVLKIHRRLHTGEKPFECKLCSTAFITKEALARHVVKVHPEEDGAEVQKEKSSHVCEVCNKSLCSKYSLRAHMNMHRLQNSSDEEAGVECNFCEKKLTCRFTLRRHVLEVHNRRDIHNCSECDMRFSRIWEYSKHLDTHLPPNKEYQCDICSKSFQKKFELLYHLQLHEAEKNITYTCFICKQEFSTSESFLEHVNGYVQSEKPTYFCPQCSNYFANPRQLKLHLSKTHKLTSISDLNYCDICQISFHNSNEYDEHLFGKHDYVDTECTECNASVKSRRQYDEHLRAHSL